MDLIAGKANLSTQADAVRASDVAAPVDVEVMETEIHPKRGWVPVDFAELFRYRELLYFLIWRDVKVRYKQTFLGLAWAIIQPVTNMLIFTLIMGNLANFADKIPDELKMRHVPYHLFIYAGLLPWMFFSVAIGTGGLALMNQQNLLTKVYFPRLFVPASVVGVALVDTGISFGVFFVLMAFAHTVPPWGIVFIPLLLLLTTLASMGISFLLSALSVTYRDFRFLIPFLVQCWTWASPVYYPQSPHVFWKRIAIELNPMFGIINAFRASLLGQHWDLTSLAFSIVETAVLLFFGLYYFKRTERRFADIA